MGASRNLAGQSQPAQHVHSAEGGQACDLVLEQTGLLVGRQIGLDGPDAQLALFDHGHEVGEGGGRSGSSKCSERSHWRCLSVQDLPSRYTNPRRSSSDWSRWRARRRSHIALPRRRHKSRHPSSAGVGTRTATSSPAR